MKAVRIGVVAVSLVVVLGLLATLMPMKSTDALPEAKEIGQNVKNFEDVAARFEDLAHDKGGKYAFDVLAVADLPPNIDLHLLGHRIGDILYEQEGVEGIAVCTQDFRNACSHSIVIGALNDYGEGALDTIRDSCTKAPGGPGAYTMCYHGLGHGVLAYYDYDIPKMVAMCQKTGTKEYNNREAVECIGGAVMELMGGGGHDPEAWRAARKKYLDDKNPTALCTGSLMPDEAREVCIIYLTPRLWELAGINLGHPDPALFPKAFSYCDAIPGRMKRLRDQCYGGFGKEFLPIVAGRDIRSSVTYTDDQLSQLVSWCGLAGNGDGAGACIGEAVASAFWGGEKDPATAFNICRVAPDDLQGACYDRLARDIAQYTDGERQASLCAQIPAGQKAQCAK